MIALYKKIIAALAVFVFIAGSLYFPLPKKAQAGFLGLDWCGTFFVCLDPGSIPSTVISATKNTTTAAASVVSAGANSTKLIVDGTPAERAITDTLLTPTTCDAFANKDLLLDTLDSAANALAGADKTQMANTLFISYRVESTRSQLRDCWVPLELISQTAKGISNSQGQNLEANRALIATKKQTLTQQLTDYEKQKKQSFQDIFEGIAYSIGGAAVNAAATKGLDALNNLKIGDYDKYIQAVSTLVYTPQQIMSNTAGNPTQGLIAAELFKADKDKDEAALKTATVLAKSEADKYRVDPVDLNWDSDSLTYYDRLGNSADPRVWPETHMTQARSTLEHSAAVSTELAHAEVANGSGYRSIRPCANTTAQQNQIDTNLNAAANKVEEADIARAIAQERGSDTLTRSRLEQEYQTAVAELKALQEKSTGGFALPCGPITKPSDLVANAANQWLATLFHQNSNFNSANPSLLSTLVNKLGQTLFNDVLNGQSGSILSDLGNNITPIAIAAGTQAGTQAANNAIGKAATNALGNILPTSGLGLPNSGIGTPPILGTPPGGVLGAATILPRGPLPAFLPRGPELSNY
jgi:hypothetical protein